MGDELGDVNYVIAFNRRSLWFIVWGIGVCIMFYAGNKLNVIEALKEAVRESE